ncbi:MAG: glycosyltransferase [Oligoflexia bacterium]|nr:glycosyltransferase [Oligoflexia bacterium]MBF0365001.1 glycosyltransferase [Oligoflexia bacterium]
MSVSDSFQNKQLFEISWEVCNQIGGIYSVLRSKADHVVKIFGDRYCLIGPYLDSKVESEFSSIDVNTLGSDHPIARTIKHLREQGYRVEFGHWSVLGHPFVILLHPGDVYQKLSTIKYLMWEKHSIECDACYDPLVERALAFGELVKNFFVEYTKFAKKEAIAHFHEWMSASAIPSLRQLQIPLQIVFTTHATSLGRYLSMAGSDLYRHMPHLNWEYEARHFNILSQVKLERAAAHGAHIFTTVSDVTASECEFLLGRHPDMVLPNGINIERFVAIHELQNLHKEFKNKIHEFTIGHFFPNYSFDLDKTLYFFTSGRFEFRNKGFDITLEALSRLNQMLRSRPTLSDITIVMFVITKNPYYNIDPRLFHQRAMTEKLRSACDEIIKGLQEKLFTELATLKTWEIPNLNALIDEYAWIKLKRVVQAWKREDLPLVVTHILQNQNDEILQSIRTHRLFNYQEDRVKIVYQPDFVSPLNPLNQSDYSQFVRGCHLGIFPSYYEPWGLTPVECLALGTPSVTSNLSGFGEYVLKNIDAPEKKGLYVLDRKCGNYDQEATALAELLFAFCQQSRRERIHQRNLLESLSEDFDWGKMISYYMHAYAALDELHHG